MIVDIDKYKANKEFIQRWFLQHGTEDVIYSIASMAVATMVPVIVVAYYIGEAAGWPQEVVDHIKVLKVFYGYSEVCNRPINSPT